MYASLSGMHQGFWMRGLSSTVCHTPADPIGIIILVDLIFPHKGCRDVPYIKKKDEIKCFSKAPKHNTINLFIFRKAHLSDLCSWNSESKEEPGDPWDIRRRVWHFWIWGGKVENREATNPESENWAFIGSGQDLSSCLPHLKTIQNDSHQL